MKVKSIVVDDEKLARKRILNLLKKYPDIEVIEECKNGEDAIKSINKHNPDLVFLDIQMKDMNGFDVIKEFDPNIKPIIIFITAYNQYAIKAFEVFAFDYLLKPFENDRFFDSIEKVIKQLSNKKAQHFDSKIEQLLMYFDSKTEEKQYNKIYSEKFPVRIGNKITFIEQDDIKYILASGSYPEVITIHKKITLRDSLTNLITQLNQDKFLRIHRSVIININYIKEVIHSSYYELDVKMKDSELFRVSKSYRKNVNQKLGLNR